MEARPGTGTDSGEESQGETWPEPESVSGPVTQNYAVAAALGNF